MNLSSLKKKFNYLVEDFRIYIEDKLGYQPYNKINYMKQIARGRQDEDIRAKKNINLVYSNNTRFKESCSLEQSGTKLSFRLHSGDNSGVLLKNLKCSHVENIESIELIIEHNRINKVYSESFDALRKLYDMNETEIPIYLFKYGCPLFLYHFVEINVIMNHHIDNVILTYDLYEHDNEDLKLATQTNNDTHLEIMLFQEQFCSNKIVKGENEIDLHFNHPVYYLITLGHTNDNVQLQTPFGKLYLKPSLTTQNYKIYPLTPSMNLEDLKMYGLNFSKMDTVKLIVNSDEDSDLKVFGVNYQGMRIINGMGGLAFAK